MGLMFFVSVVQLLQNLPSPTTGAFSGQAMFQNMTDSGYNQLDAGIKEEEKFSSDFSFQPQTKWPATTSSSFFQPSSTVVYMSQFFFIYFLHIGSFGVCLGI